MTTSLFPVAVLLIDQGPLCFPNPLDDYLLGRLSGDPSEVRGCDFDLDDVAQLVRRINSLGFFKGNFSCIIGNFFDDCLPGEDGDFPVLPSMCTLTFWAEP